MSPVPLPLEQVLGGREAGSDANSNSGGNGSSNAGYRSELVQACEGLGLTRFQAERAAGSSAIFITRLQVGSPWLLVLQEGGWPQIRSRQWRRCAMPSVAKRGHMYASALHYSTSRICTAVQHYQYMHLYCNLGLHASATPWRERVVSEVYLPRFLLTFRPQGAGVDLQNVTLRDDIAPYNRSDLDALLAGGQLVTNVLARTLFATQKAGKRGLGVAA